MKLPFVCGVIFDFIQDGCVYFEICSVDGMNVVVNAPMLFSAGRIWTYFGHSLSYLVIFRVISCQHFGHIHTNYFLDSQPVAKEGKLCIGFSTCRQRRQTIFWILNL